MTPLIAGIMGLKTHARDFWWAFATGLIVEGVGVLLVFQDRPITFQSWIVDRASFTSWLFSFSANFFAYFLSHYLRYGAFVRAAPEHSTEIAWQPKWETLMNWLAALLPTPHNAKRFARATVFADKEGHVLALFIAVNYMAPFFMSVSVTKTEFTNTMLFLKAVAAFLCTGILANSRWPKAWKTQYYELYWISTIIYCIPFMAAFTFLMDRGSTITIFNILLAVMLLVAIVNWKGFLAMSAIGIGLASSIYHFVYGPIHFNLGVEGWFLLIYGAGFAVLIGGLFVRKKAQYAADSLCEKNTFANFISHELGNHLAIMGCGTTIRAFLKQCDQRKKNTDTKLYEFAEHQYQQLSGLANDLISEQKHVRHIIKTYNDMLREDMGQYHPLTSLATIAQRGCDAVARDLHDKTKIKVLADPDFERSLPADVFQYVVFNLVKNAILHGQATEVTVCVDGDRQVLSVRDNGKGIPVALLPRLFQLYHTGNSDKGTGVGLAFVQRAVAGVRGDLQLVQNTQVGDPYTTFQITFLL